MLTPKAFQVIFAIFAPLLLMDEAFARIWCKNLGEQCHSGQCCGDLWCRSGNGYGVGGNAVGHCAVQCKEAGETCYPNECCDNMWCEDGSNYHIGGHCIVLCKRAGENCYPGECCENLQCEGGGGGIQGTCAPKLVPTMTSVNLIHPPQRLCKEIGERCYHGDCCDNMWCEGSGWIDIGICVQLG